MDNPHKFTSYWISGGKILEYVWDPARKEFYRQYDPATDTLLEVRNIKQR